MRIEGYFSGIKRANEVVDRLKSEGFKDSYADLNEHYITNNNPGENPPATDSGAVNLSSYVLNTEESLDNSRLGPLLAASPMVSGMGGFEEIADVNYKVIVNVNSNNVERAKEILKNMGGEINNPNFEIPKGLDSISTDEVVEKMLAEVEEDR